MRRYVQVICSPLTLSSTRWNGENFIESARDVRLGGSILYADLKAPEGAWNASRIDLNNLIGNEDGQLVNGTTQTREMLTES